MGVDAIGAEAPENDSEQEHTIQKALITAHLLTGDIFQAEEAVLNAIDSLDPAGSPEMLLRGTMHAAIQDPQVATSKRHESPGLCLPVELQGVLRLPEDARRCFVLRVLAGLPRQTCARLLRMTTFQVDQYTCAALQSLPVLNKRVQNYERNCGRFQTGHPSYQ